MAQDDKAATGPQIYLITPALFEPDDFLPKMQAVLDIAPVACVRLAMARAGEDRVIRAADALREMLHAREVALVIEAHVELADRLGLDGAHLPRGTGSIRKLRSERGPEFIIGADCGASRHDGMTAAEAGADYVAFSPAGESALGTGARAEAALFAWWSEMIEVPVVAEGALSPALVADLAPVADFIAFGDEVWDAADPLAAFRALVAPLGH